MAAEKLYRVVFHNQGRVYEIYAREVNQAGVMGFVEIADLVFGEKSELVVDPSEEKLRSEFEGVSRTMIPMHAVVRIDEVEKQGSARITEGGEGNVTPFPGGYYGPGGPSGGSS